MSEHPFAPPETSEPPGSRFKMLVTGGAGVVLTLAAFVIGRATAAPTATFDYHWADGPRVLLATLGMILAGCAVTVRHRDWLAWMPMALAGLISYGIGTQPPAEISWMVLKPIRNWYSAMPNSWDSIQFLYGVIGAVSFVAAIFTLLPTRVVLSLIFGMLCFYGSGILNSVLSPPATPFLVEEYWRRVSRFHSQFLYINNAYHFYSPEPGPPSELWVCLKYEPLSTSEDNEEQDSDWIKMPDRARDTMDPLRLSYFRRIALVDQVAQIQLNYTPIFPDEMQKSNARRMNDLARIPKDPNVSDSAQYLPPQDQVVRMTLPSYVKHFAKRFGKPGRTVKSVKVYRTLHEVLPLERTRAVPLPVIDLNKPGEFHWSEVKQKPKTIYIWPYDWALYHPYYQGEYDLNGKLLDPTDPELYWAVPIVDRKVRTAEDTQVSPKDFDRYYIDYVSIHAGSKRPKE